MFFLFHSWFSCHVMYTLQFITFIERAFIIHDKLFSTLFPHLFPLMCIHVVSYKHGGVPLGQCHLSMGEGVVCTP